MTKSTTLIEDEALALTREARIRLAVKLLDSVETRPAGDPANFDEAWIKEAQRRYNEYLSGRDIAVPAEDVFNEFKEENQVS